MAGEIIPIFNFGLRSTLGCSVRGFSSILMWLLNSGDLLLWFKLLRPFKLTLTDLNSLTKEFLVIDEILDIFEGGISSLDFDLTFFDTEKFPLIESEMGLWSLPSLFPAADRDLDSTITGLRGAELFDGTSSLLLNA